MATCKWSKVRAFERIEGTRQTAAALAIAEVREQRIARASESPLSVSALASEAGIARASAQRLLTASHMLVRASSVDSLGGDGAATVLDRIRSGKFPEGWRDAIADAGPYTWAEWVRWLDALAASRAESDAAAARLAARAAERQAAEAAAARLVAASQDEQNDAPEATEVVTVEAGDAPEATDAPEGDEPDAPEAVEGDEPDAPVVVEAVEGDGADEPGTDAPVVPVESTPGRTVEDDAYLILDRIAALAARLSAEQHHGVDTFSAYAWLASHLMAHAGFVVPEAVAAGVVVDVFDILTTATQAPEVRVA